MNKKEWHQMDKEMRNAWNFMRFNVDEKPDPKNYYPVISENIVLTSKPTPAEVILFKK